MQVVRRLYELLRDETKRNIQTNEVVYGEPSLVAKIKWCGSSGWDILSKYQN